MDLEQNFLNTQVGDFRNFCVGNKIVHIYIFSSFFSDLN